MTIIDMRTMRFINLLEKVSNVKTNRCFFHNGIIFFAVNKSDISRAIGPAAINIKKLFVKIGKKVRIIENMSGVNNIKSFIEEIVYPVKLKSLEIVGNSAIINAGNNQNKAILIGRNRRREEELQKIIQDYFNLNIKIV